MSKIEVYHGGTEIVERPLCHLGREYVDFGQGFYVTDIKAQALTWAERTSRLRKAEPLLNVYSFDKEAFMHEARCKVFTAYDCEWLRFIVANRRGEKAAAPYDYIEGGIANDRVINTINFFMQGYYSEEQPVRRLSEHQPNNQICLRNQSLLDKYLYYERTEKA